MTSDHTKGSSAGIMAAMLAHEVKNPLSGIRSAAQLLSRSVSEQDQPLTELICQEVDRISALVDRMECFSMEPLQAPHPVNIHEVLQYVRTLAGSSFARHVTIESRYDPSLPEVAGDKDLLIQLFVNVIKNAAEALNGREDGRIMLSTHYQVNHKVRVAGSEPFISLPIAVVVEDNGCGVPEAMRDALFEPFSSTKQEGKGLGLAIVAKIVADHGGTIALETGAENSTRFKLLLPAC